MKVKVTRAFLIKGERQEPGAVIEVAEMFGRELIALGKAERAADTKPAAPAKPMTTKSAAALTGEPAKE